jgi:hypothetical protein
VRFQDGNQLRVERSDQIIIVLLLSRRRKCSPGKVIDVPGMCKIDIRESKGDCPFGFRECRNEEIGS